MGVTTGSNLQQKLDLTILTDLLELGLFQFLFGLTEFHA